MFKVCRSVARAFSSARSTREDENGFVCVLEIHREAKKDFEKLMHNGPHCNYHPPVWHCNLNMLYGMLFFSSSRNRLTKCMQINAHRNPRARNLHGRRKRMMWKLFLIVKATRAGALWVIQIDFLDDFPQEILLLSNN